ncbi:hypothetical protein OLQ17_09255 [Campylobacter jejuni]|nr:hypothetical protein [Campylobacter jejuni]
MMSKFHKLLIFLISLLETGNKKKIIGEEKYIFFKNTNQEELKEIFSNSINSSNTGLSDSKIAKITTIPLPTLNTWKKDKLTYRKKIYDFLKSCDESRLRNIF